MKKRKLSRSTGGNVTMIVFLIIAGAFTALPIVYSVINSFKPINELFIFPPRFYVKNPTFDNYSSLFKMQINMLVPFERYLFNSVLVSVIVTVTYVLIASLAAYPMAKLSFFGKTLVIQVVVWAILFRAEVTAIPQYIIISKMKMLNTYWAVILPTLATSFGVFLMRQFMASIPDEILKSAEIDGCGEWQKFFRIVFPSVKPAWLTLVIFTFQSIWNTTGIQFIYTENLKILPTALSQISTAGIGRAGIASAIAVLLMIPPIGIFMICQNSVIETMAYSGLKG